MNTNIYTAENVRRDLLAGLVVFLVALPLCLGIALASNAPMVAGLTAGIVGGVLVGALSGSHTSVSGPAAGLAAVVVAQLMTLGSFPAFALAVTLAGVIQVALGALRAGFIASFFPSTVIKGLLAAIGVLLILKQFPHVLGHDPDPIGEMDFAQPDGQNTFTEIIAAFFDIHVGAALTGLLSVALLIAWGRVGWLKRSPLPAPLAAVAFGMSFGFFLDQFGPSWAIGTRHFVQMPKLSGPGGISAALAFPDWSQLTNPAVYVAAVTVAIVATLETLLNVEAVDKLDPQRRVSPPNRELLAQGAGNIVSGLLGGLPITSVIVRSSANVDAQAKTHMSAIFHGIFLFAATVFIPDVLNRIPLACLAAILLMTGFKLASPNLLSGMWRAGRTQFLPFIITIVAIVLIDLLVGVAIGLGVSVLFILYSNFQGPMRKVMERHINQDVLRIQLANQVSFFSRATLERTLTAIPRNGHVLLDARETDYVDADVLDLIDEFRTKVAPAKGIEVSVLGFKDRYPQLPDAIQFVDYTTRDLQAQMEPGQIIKLLQEGNERFRTGARVERDLVRQQRSTAAGQAPLAVILSCIDSRTPAELIFDLGIGDIFSVRVAGNVAQGPVLGSVEYGCKVAGAKLLAVIGHTSCGAVTAAVDLSEQSASPSDATGCSNIGGLIGEIQHAIDTTEVPPRADAVGRQAFVDDVSKRNVKRTIRSIREQSETLRLLSDAGTIDIVGGLYNVQTGAVTFFGTDDT